MSNFDAAFAAWRAANPHLGVEHWQCLPFSKQLRWRRAALAAQNLLQSQNSAAEDFAREMFEAAEWTFGADWEDMPGSRREGYIKMAEFAIERGAKL